MRAGPVVNAPTVIILASGRGERFVASGGRTDKLQARLAGKTVLEHTLAAVRVSGLPWHLEDAGHPGMGDSIAAAVRATMAAAGWLILPGDLPLIHGDTLRAVAAALCASAAVVPVYQGQHGHPVGFHAGFRSELLQLHGSRGAAEIVRSGCALELPVGDIGCVTDVDTVADLRAVAHACAPPEDAGPGWRSARYLPWVAKEIPQNFQK
ncbi:NTP transferase domain-containing protein [Polaromonas sp. P2-4]|nr:NTP transferase domain-containing protein [Polaromonas sp. P2-4]